MNLREVISMRRHNKRGQVTIEAAIAFTITLIFLATVISSLQYYRTDILMRRACEQTCEKMAILYPLSVPASDALSTMLNAFPDMGIGATKGADIVSKVTSVALGADRATGNNIKELILQGLFAKTMEEQIRSAYIERNGGSDFFAPDEIRVYFEISETHHVIEVTTEYTVVTLAGVKTRSIYSVIPLYGDPVLMLNGADSETSDEKDENKDSIWSLSNFARGEAFRERYGANLPKTFPVIDAVNDGDITAIRSIDLTSPYYQDVSNIEKEIKEDILALSGFEPQSANINGTVYSVDYIDSRYLTVIIPENSGEIGKAVIDELKGYAFVKGVILDVKECETSNKYQAGDQA
jgi:hypothetical protein